MTNLKLFINNLKGDKKSAHTIQSYATDIKQMLSFVNKVESEIVYADLLNWKSDISELSSATVNRKITAVKQYFDFLTQVDIISHNPSLTLKNVRVENKEKIPLTPEQIRAMINAGKNVRDKAIVCLLASSGVRISELINLKVSDIQQELIVIKGKGRQERIIYLNRETIDLINEYLTVRPETELPNLFISNQLTPMSNRAINNTLKTIAKRANIDNNVACHLFRCSSASLMAENNVPIQVIQDVLGHKNLSTTRIYVKNNQSALKAAMTMSMF